MDAFIHTHCASWSQALPTAHLWMKSITELHERTDVQFETVDDPSKYQLDSLKEFNGIYIGGGNTWSLIQELKILGFLKF